MKKLLIAALTVLSANAFAADCTTSKEIQLPQWTIGKFENYRVYVSNVSDSAVDVEIKFYDSDKDRYLETSEAGTQFSYNAQFTANPALTSTSLAAGHTGRVTLHHGGVTQYGLATISWTAQTCLPEALQASVMYWTSDDDALTWRDVNGGKAF